MKYTKFLFHVTLVVFVIKECNGDKPCAGERYFREESVVCVCNTTYCDTLTRWDPEPGTFITYTSSKEGLRFKKNKGFLLSADGRKFNTWSREVLLTLDAKKQYQAVEGFGGAVTDAAGINWRALSAPLQQLLVDAYFSESGIEYSMVRVPVGGSDFSTRPYAYNELPAGDAALTNFSLSYEDYHYKLPLIKAGQAAARVPLLVVATVWSPPPWMKTNGQFSGLSRLKPEYYDTYADYHYKFVEKYAAEGVPVWGITTTNEPTNGVLPFTSFNSLGWTPATLGKWIANHLGPRIRNSTYSNVKIIAGDDQRPLLRFWVIDMILKEPRALQYIDGVAVHYYMDFITPASILTNIMEQLPNKFLIATEACEGSFPWQRHKVLLGSWDRAYNYISDIITDLNHNAVSWLDWNLCLSKTGGPNWAHNYVDSPIIVMPEQNIFIKEPMFYAMGHFSKFIPRGSRRISITMQNPTLESVAFLTPRGTTVVVFYNKGYSRLVKINIGNMMAKITAPADSVNTVEIKQLAEAA